MRKTYEVYETDRHYLRRDLYRRIPELFSAASGSGQHLRADPDAGVKIEHVDAVGTFLVEIMPMMFIPAGVGLVTSFGQLRPVLFPVLVITVVTTFLVMAVTGKVTDAVIGKASSADAGAAAGGDPDGSNAAEEISGASLCGMKVSKDEDQEEV